jgi:hypothetical protein
MCCKGKKCFGAETRVVARFNDTIGIVTVNALSMALDRARFYLLTPDGWTELIDVISKGESDTYTLAHWPLHLTKEHHVALVIVGCAPGPVETLPSASRGQKQKVYDLVTHGDRILVGPYIVKTTVATTEQILKRGESWLKESASR